MLDFARSITISTQTSNIYLNQLQWYGQFGEVYMPFEVLSLEIYPNVTNSFPSVPCRDWPAAIDHRSVVSTIAPPVRTDVPRTLPPLRTSSLGHLPSQADERKTLAYDLYYNYLSVLIRVTIWVCEILTLFSDFSISIFESIPQLYKQKSWVKDVIQGFAQKAVKLNTKLSQSTIKLGKKKKTRKIPRNSRQNFRNSREFPPGILGVRDSREFPNGNSRWPCRPLITPLR